MFQCLTDLVKRIKFYELDYAIEFQNYVMFLQKWITKW